MDSTMLRYRSVPSSGFLRDGFAYPMTICRVGFDSKVNDVRTTGEDVSNLFPNFLEETYKNYRMLWHKPVHKKMPYLLKT